MPLTPVDSCVVIASILRCVLLILVCMYCTYTIIHVCMHVLYIHLLWFQACII